MTLNPIHTATPTANNIVMNSYSSSSSSSSSIASIGDRDHSKGLTYGGGFPQKLYSLLTFERNPCLQWFEDGSGFRIIDPVTFENSVISKYFKQKKIRSFFRQLNVYGFVRVQDPSALCKYSFRHPMFLRQQPQLVDRLDRRKPAYSRRVMRETEELALAASEEEKISKSTSEDSDDAVSCVSNAVSEHNNNIPSSSPSSSSFASPAASSLSTATTVFSLPVTHRRPSPTMVPSNSFAPRVFHSYSTDSECTMSSISVHNSYDAESDYRQQGLSPTENMLMMQTDSSFNAHGFYLDLDEDIAMLQEVLLMDSP